MAEKLTAGMRRILQCDTNRSNEIQREVVRLARQLRKSTIGVNALWALLKAKGAGPFYGKPKILQDWNSYCRIVAYYGEDFIREIPEVRRKSQIIDMHDQVFAVAQEADLPIGQESIQWLRSKLQANADRPIEKRKHLIHFINELKEQQKSKQKPNKSVSKPGKSKGTVSTFMTAKSAVVVRASPNEPDAVNARQIETATTYIRDANRPDSRQIANRLSLDDLRRVVELEEGIRDSNASRLPMLQELLREREEGAA